MIDFEAVQLFKYSGLLLWGDKTECKNVGGVKGYP